MCTLTAKTGSKFKKGVVTAASKQIAHYGLKSAVFATLSTSVWVKITNAQFELAYY